MPAAAAAPPADYRHFLHLADDQNTLAAAECLHLPRQQLARTMLLRLALPAVGESLGVVAIPTRQLHLP